MILEYKLNKCDGRVRLVLEIHLFVNPLGESCRNSEADVAKCSKMAAVKVRCTIVPLLNMATIQQTIRMYNLPEDDLEIRSKVCQTLYQSILDYKAAQFQGQKRARKFLLYQQQALEENNLNYDDKVTEQIAKKVSLDVDMFNEDRHSDLVEEAFRDDQQLASSMGISATETAIVVDTTNPSCGIKIDHFTFHKLLAIYEKVHCARCALQHLANHCIEIKSFHKRG